MSIGRLWVWGDTSTARKNYLEPILKRTGVNYSFISHETKSLPSLNIDPNNDVILALGGNPAGSPLQELKNNGLIKKNLTLGSSRGKVYHLPSGVPCLTSYTASVRDVQYDLFVELESDVQLAVRLLTTKSLTPPLLDFQWVDDLTEVLSVIKKHHIKWNNEKFIDVALDLETTGLIAYDPTTWVITLQVSTDEKSARVIKFDNEFQPRKPDQNIDQGTPQCREELLWVQINDLLNDPKISLKGANLKYDLGWIAEKWGIFCTNFKFDTLLVGSLLDENRSNSLKTHAYVYTPFGGYESDIYDNYDIAKAYEIPDVILLPYCGYDTAVCLQVARKMKEELLQKTNSRLIKFYTNILHPAARAYERVERTGLLVDREYYLGFKKELEHKLATNLALAHRTLPGRLLSKWRDSDDEKCISLARAAMIADYMFGKPWLNLKPVMFTPKPDKNGVPKPSTSLEHFLKFKDDETAGPFVKILEEYKDSAKTLSTYIDGFLADLRYDNRFHATFFLFKGQEGQEDDAGTNSGRISIKNPALQCLVGDSLVLTDKGEVPIKVMVEQCEKGEQYKVLTHTGKWQDVIGSYRNGVQPVFKITTSEGYSVTCTANHPILTDAGFIRTDALEVGYNVFTHCLIGVQNGNVRRLHRESIRAVNGATQGQNSKGNQMGLSMQLREFENRSSGESSIGKYDNLRVHVGGEESNSRSSLSQGWEDNQNVQCVVMHEDTLQQSESEVLQGLRCEGYNLLSGMGGLQQLPKGYGGMPTSIRVGAQRCERELQQRELLLGNCAGTTVQQKEFTASNVQRGNTLLGGVGLSSWGTYSWESEEGLDNRTGTNDTQRSEAEEALSSGFVTDTIVSIEPLGTEETYDLTVANCHSFIANGMVVHNTIPKKTKWAKPLRRAFIAPKGYVILSADYSQGELRIAAELAQEENMIMAYNKGIDLHAFTGAGLASIPFEEFASYNDSGDKELQKIYDVNRQKAKGANFGLLYGMGAEGFQIYAETAYKVKMTLKEAEEAREKFFATYPRLQPWHKETKTLALAQGFIDSPLGRRRHLPLLKSPDKMTASKELRRSVNASVQGTLSDFSLWATAILEKEGVTKEAPVVLMVHDQLIGYLPEDNWEYYAKRYRDVMENLPVSEFGWNPRLKFEVDVEMGMGDKEKGIPPNLAQLVKAKKLSTTW